MIGAPKLSPDFLLWIENRNPKDKTILEFGAGYSTIFFSKYFENVCSFESNLEWITKIETLSMHGGIDNIKLNLLNHDVIHQNHFIELIKSADYFLVDTAPNSISRYYLTLLIHNHKKENSIIVLDNSEWVPDAYEFLRENYYCIDFPYERENGVKTETSVFFQKRNKNKSVNII